MRASTDSESRAQSDVIGIALLFAVVIAGTVAIIGVGSSVLADARTDAQIDSAEHAMTKFDATAALIALGRSDSQRAKVTVDSIGESLAVRPNQGWMEVTVANNTTTHTVMNRTLGAVVYENDDVNIAYQGGGVWKNQSGSTTMISPPEFHYRGSTLTLPLITVAGGDATNGDIILRNTNQQDRRYPNTSINSTFRNPLTDGQVNVTVHSEYYEAWGRFFEQRTSGVVHYDHPSNTVTIELVVPFQAPFETPLIATEPNGVNVNGGTRDYNSGEDYPSADGEIERQIADCQSGSCDNSTTSFDNATTYYVDSSLGGNLEIDTTDGDVNIVVNGNLDPSDIDIQGSNTVWFYVANDYHPSGSDLNTDGDANQLFVYVHSDGGVDLDGNVGMHGVIYAPDSDVDLNGNTYFRGSIVGQSVTINGNPANNIHHDEDIEGIDLGLDAPSTTHITYLYVSATNISVSST